MKKHIGFGFRIFICILVISGLLAPIEAFAREGDSGYEGGISSGEAPNKTSFEYQEVSFLSGEPVVLKGTLTIKKTLKQDINKSSGQAAGTVEKQDLITATYTYSLKNLDRAATLSRVLTYSTKVTTKDNGQKVEETLLTRSSETVKIDGATYTLRNYDFSRSNIIDPQPAINYYAGDIWGRKTYQIGTGTGTTTSGGTITVDITGSFYGYDQYWGTTEVEVLNYVIQGEQRNGDTIDEWGGNASVSSNLSTTKQIKYVENKPDQMSFEGGYVQTQYNNSVMEYSASMPEFDSKGIPTDRMIDTKDSLKLETFPVQTRLPVPDLAHLRGHWSENNINTLFSLEIFKEKASSFNPEQYMTRAEFASAIVQAAREVPVDPIYSGKTVRSTRTTGRGASNQVISPFKDVSVNDDYFTSIDSAFKRGLLSGRDNGSFSPEGYLTVADAITVFINSLGLKGLAPSPSPVTTFTDNDQIPGYARDAAYVAQHIGIVSGDSRGYLHPNDRLTKAKAAELLMGFIRYMQEGIRKDYRERIINY